MAITKKRQESYYLDSSESSCVLQEDTVPYKGNLPSMEISTMVMLFQIPYKST